MSDEESSCCSEMSTGKESDDKGKRKNYAKSKQFSYMVTQITDIKESLERQEKMVAKFLSTAAKPKAGAEDERATASAKARMEIEASPAEQNLNTRHGSIDMQHNLQDAPIRSRSHLISKHHLQDLEHFDEWTIECPQRKKARPSTNASQLSSQSQTTLTLPSPNMTHSSTGDITGVAKSALQSAEFNIDVMDDNNNPQTTANKENTGSITNNHLKLPHSLPILKSDKMTWTPKSYTDVMPREERHSTVKDFANQPNIANRLNGWKIHKAKSDMERIVEEENLSLEQLSIQSKELETYETQENNADIDRVLELMKGNIQRNKMVADGVTHAMNQMMKILEHKDKVTDIISRAT